MLVVLPAWLRLLSFGDRDVVFDERTGRHVAYPQGGADRQLSTDQRLVALGMLSTPDPARWVLYRKHHPILLPRRSSLLVPDSAEHPAGGHDWKLFRLGSQELALWSAADGKRTMAQLAMSLGLPVPAIVARAGPMAAHNVQAFVARPDRVAASHPSLCVVVGPPREKHRRTAAMYDDHSTQLGAFHGAISDEKTRFDHAETTLAHALSVPHAALGGQPFGARLADALFERCRARSTPLKVLEVGGGTGELGAAFVQRSQTVNRRVRYTRVDRSPALLQLQSENNPDSEGKLGDALALPLPALSIDLLIANEMIADLPSKLGPDGWHNVGAEAFVEECARVLRAGGMAYLSEFGSLDDPPEETEQLDHPEVSIRFLRLQAVAEAAGLRATVMPIAELLSMNLEASWLWRPHLAAVRAVDRLNSRALTAARAWAPETLATPEPIEGLRWVSMREEGPGPLPARMFALLLEK